MRKIGLIINPIAGIGGKVGLKGSDGLDTFYRATELGAVKESNKKTLIALKELQKVKESIEIYTCPGDMGEKACEEAGLSYTVIGGIYEELTSYKDTICAARELKELGVELLLFSGGDGTARDIMDAVGMSMTVLGIPAGCKIHSGVYAVNPAKAGRLVCEFVKGNIKETAEAEVMDIDEELFRKGIVQAKLYGYLRILKGKQFVQSLKSGSGVTEDDSLELISNYIADIWEENTLYIVGTGSTIDAIMKKMNLSNTLLGIDLVYKRKVIARDCSEKEILDIMKNYESVKIIVTVIGGQGYIFGRGNQQISAEIIRRAGKENIIVAATKSKILKLSGQCLYVDTGDDEVDSSLTGYIKVIVGYKDIVIAKVTH